MNPAPVETKIRQRLIPPSLVFAVLFFFTLFLLDFPKPGFDDLFFTGASLNLVQGGDLSNPLIERQAFPGHFYFVHPPTYTYVLAGWLKIFGISTFAMLCFQLLMYLLVCFATILILRRYQASLFIEYLVPLAVAAGFLPFAFRPESFSAALTMCGLALLLRGPAGIPALFCGFFLMILGASAAERMTFYSGALILAVFFELRNLGVPTRHLIGSAVSALLLICLILADLIGFRFSEFWTVFHLCAAYKTGGNKIVSAMNFLHSMTIVQWPVFLLWLAFLPTIFFLHDKNLRRVVFFLFVSFLMIAAKGALFITEIWYMILLLLLIAAAFSNQLSGKRKIIFPTLVAIVLLIADSRNFIYIAGIAGGKISADKGDRLVEAQGLRTIPGHTVLIDSQTARYVFDYRLPPGVLDWTFAAPFPEELAADVALQPGDIYMLGPDSVDWLNIRTHLNMSLPTWAPFGPRKTLHKFPQWVYLIHPKECGDLKAAN